MPPFTRTSLFTAACALGATLLAPRAQADSLDWSGVGYSYNAGTQVGAAGSTNANNKGGVVTTVNGNTVSILYNTGAYFNAYNGQASPAVGTYTSGTTTYSDGGVAGSQALQILSNFDNGTVLAANAGITVTVFFSKPVSGLMFSFWDVDTSATGTAAANSYNDLITNLYGRNSTSNNPNANIVPGLMTAAATNTYGTGSNANGNFATLTSSRNAAQGTTATIPAGSVGSSGGVAALQFAQPVDSFSFTYTDTGVSPTANGTAAHGNIQMLALSNLQFVTVPEPSTWAMVGVAGVAGAWALRRRARRTA